MYDTMPPNADPAYLMHELELLKQRVAKLEDKIAARENESCTTPNDTGIPDLTCEQTMMVEMMSTNPSIGWKVALRKLLMMVFGEETLARSCCKGRKNATFQPLDETRLNAIKGTYDTLFQ